ncbi:hypothetical protein F4678DRAFT_366927 [Xylaria arbuscula]|nr:hypothetical protein F4678DRAFT_366927 [Xylaria arbuscula]
MSAPITPSDALPLETIHLNILPKTTHNIAWSPDNELAIACDDSVLIYAPDFSLASSTSSSATTPAADGREGPTQYSEVALRFAVAPLRSPELNRPLFDAVDADFAGYSFFTGAGDGVLTGHGSTLNHTVALAWSRRGLGRMGRAALAVLTSAGILTVYCQGAPDAVAASAARNAASLRPWVAAWHVGAGMLVPAAPGHEPPEKKENIVAFAWAEDLGDADMADMADMGRMGNGALLAYMNSEREVVLLRVFAAHDFGAPAGHPGNWKVLEVARFGAEGPHPVLTDPTDPDYTFASSSFALGWSPWLRRGRNSLTCILSYVAHNYIGFRQITLDKGPGSPGVHVSRADASGVCLHLSTDAFVVWEDKIWVMPGSNVCRGVIASPTKVQAFELPFDHISPVPKHSTDKCDTTYPSEEDMVHMGNPITGLIIHHPSRSQNISTPSYTLVRLSATHDNPAWHQTNLIIPPSNTEDSASGGLRWATEINQIIEHQLPRALVRRGGNTGAAKGQGEADFDFEDEDEEDDDFDSDMDDDMDDDADEEDEDSANFFGIGIRGVDTEDQVHLHRVRVWGLTVSPAGGTSAVFISQHSNLELERDTFAGLKCRVLFGAHPGIENLSLDDEEDMSFSGVRKMLSTEAQAWDWMYGGGSPVFGYSVPNFSIPPAEMTGAAREPLRDRFGLVARGQRCVFCDLPLKPSDDGSSSRCENGHVFENCANTGVPITAPNVSRTCGVCGMKCIKAEELLNIAPHMRDVIENDISSHLCGGCGGKFTN